MRIGKQIGCFLLSVTVFICTVCSVFPISAETSESPSYLEFQARFYAAAEADLKTFYEIFCEDTERSFPATYFHYLEEDGNFQKSVTAWEALHIATEPSYSMESGMISKKDMFKLAIFDALGVNYANSPEAFAYVAYEQINYVVDMCQTLRSETGIDIKDIKSMVVDGKAKEALRAFAGEMNLLDSAVIFNGLCRFGNNMYETINQIASYIAISHMGQSLDDVLTAICDAPSSVMGGDFDYADYKELAQAAEECREYIREACDSLLEQLLSGVVTVTAETIGTVVGLVVDIAWNTLISLIPGGAAVLVVAKGIRCLGNSVFNLDRRNQCYYQFYTLVGLENMLRYIVKKSADTYLSDSTADTAAYAMRAVEMYKRCNIIGHNAAIEFVEVVSTSSGSQAFDWITNNYTEGQEVIRDIAALRDNRQENFNAFEEATRTLYKKRYNTAYDETLSDYNTQNEDVYGSAYLSRFKYSVNTGGKSCTITGFSGTATDLVIPSRIGRYTVKAIGEYAFKNAKLYGTVTVPGCVDTIGYGAFFLATLSGIKILSGVTAIDQYAFSECTSLRSVSIPDSVTSIGVGAFQKCTSLTAIPVANSVTAIADNTFYGCTGLKSVTIPHHITSIGEQAFARCSALTNITVPTTVTSIKKGAFLASGLTEFTIPDSITEIEDNTFYSCEALKRVTIPDSVTSIGKKAFAYCYSLTDVTIPPAVTTLNDSVFFFCTALDNVVIPDSVTTIDYGAFGYCESLTNISIPNSVTTIGDGAFIDCKSLTQFPLPDSVVSIAIGAFFGCSALTNVVIPPSVTYLGPGVFSGCHSLQSVTIPHSITELFDSVFSDCPALTNITIPSSVTKISHYTFSNTSLHNVWVEPSNPNYCSADGVLYTKDMAELLYYPGGRTDSSFTVPEGVVSINTYAVNFCNSLTTLILPETITTIRANAITNCPNLAMVVIPESVKSIATSNFRNCAKLTVGGYTGSYAQTFAAKQSLPFVCVHRWINATCTAPKTCSACGETVSVALGHSWKDGGCTACGTPRGDMTGDDALTIEDSVYLLYHTMLPGEYPLIGQSGDINGDGVADKEDAVFLLYHFLLPELYPLG